MFGRMKNRYYKKRLMRNLLLLLFCFLAIKPFAQQKNIYHNGWIDFNKNRKKDVFEDPLQPEKNALMTCSRK